MIQSDEDMIDCHHSSTPSKASHPPCAEPRPRALKAALWALCSLLNCEQGFAYLARLNSQLAAPFAGLPHLVAALVHVAESHPLLSVRATALLGLNLLSKARTGASLLARLGWLAFQVQLSRVAIQRAIVF